MKFATITTDTGRNFRLLEVVDALKYMIKIKPNTKYRLYAEEVEAEPEHNLTSTEQYAVNQCIQDMASEPEKCVWRRSINDNGWMPGCWGDDSALELPPKCSDEKTEVLRWVKYCYLCGRPAKIPLEPTIPPGYREPDE